MIIVFFVLTTSLLSIFCSLDWIKLRNNQNHISFGITSEYNETNNPHFRANAAHFLYNNSIWFFGGHSDLSTQYNDLWEYSLELNQYRYHVGGKGANDVGYDGNYEELFSYNSTFYPKSRFLMGFMKTVDDTFLILGGAFINLNKRRADESETFNDVWEFNPRLKLWRILKPCYMPFEDYRIIGTPDVFNDSNIPVVFWGIRTIKRTDDIYIIFMGGESVSEYWNELWEYSIASNSFRFIKGKTDASAVEKLEGILPAGGRGSCDVDALPPGRIVYNAWWYDDYYWLHGGLRYNLYVGRHKSDFWRIKLNNVSYEERRWCWISGVMEEDVDSVFDAKEFGSNFYPADKGASMYFMDWINEYFVVWGGGTVGSVSIFICVKTNVFSGYSDGWVFNPRTIEWKFCTGWIGIVDSVDNFPHRRSGSVFEQVDSNSIVMIGGLFDSEGQYGLTDVWKYNRTEYDCFSIDSESRTTCNGEGNCISPDICDCSASIYYWGEECKNFLSGKYFSRKILPVLLSTSFFVGILVLSLCLICLIVCFILLTVITSFGIVVWKKGTLSSIYKRMKLKNVDVLLDEQRLNESVDGLVKIKINHEKFTINFDDVKLKKLIGSGGSGGSVYKCEYQGAVYAFKSFKYVDVIRNESVSEEFEREVSILASFRHKNILGFNGAAIKCPRIGILMEYCENGDLKSFLKLNENYKMEEKMRMMREISLGMAELHKKQVIHRDLKLENVLVDFNEVCKVMDFGLSRYMDKNLSLTRGIGTVIYMAPELIRGEDYNLYVDTYSFGILFWIVLTEIFQPYDDDNVQFKVANNADYRPDVKKLKCRKWIKSLIEACWNHNSKRRPSFSKIVDILTERETNSNVIYIVVTKDLGEVDEEKAEDFLLEEKSLSALEEIIKGKLSIENFEAYVKVKDGVFIPLVHESILKKEVTDDSLIVVKVL